MESKLGLGGHSYISPLGNDPRPTFEEQCAIVAECLDGGIRLMDTTYYQERVALGNVLEKLGRRAEARIMAWNFFARPGHEEELVPSTPYEPDHLARMLEELHTDRIDILVIHAHDDAQRLHEEMALAERWLNEGKIRAVGLGMATKEHLKRLPIQHPFTHVLAPFNVFHPHAERMFQCAKAKGLSVIAMSPFVRGWKLEEIPQEKHRVADVLLRWVTSQPFVDHLIVAIRKQEWVRANLETERRGSLTAAEQAELHTWLAAR